MLRWMATVANDGSDGAFWHKPGLRVYVRPEAPAALRDGLSGAIEFYDRFYSPNNAILIIAGDVTAEEVRPLAEKYYGVIPVRAVQRQELCCRPVRFQAAIADSPKDLHGGRLVD